MPPKRTNTAPEGETESKFVGRRSTRRSSGVEAGSESADRPATNDNQDVLQEVAEGVTQRLAESTQRLTESTQRLTEGTQRLTIKFRIPSNARPSTPSQNVDEAEAEQSAPAPASLQPTPSRSAPNILPPIPPEHTREWIQTRIYPYLKQAVTVSLDGGVQYPLQWLGEQLILQSIVYEGNPDNTKIRERFVYDHEVAGDRDVMERAGPGAQNDGTR